MQRCDRGAIVRSRRSLNGGVRSLKVDVRWQPMAPRQI